MNHQIGMFDNLPPIERENPRRPVQVKAITQKENRIYVKIDALRERKYKYLETVAVNAFQHWQTHNYLRLGYKSSKIIKYDSEPNPEDEDRYYFILVIELVY